MDNIISYITCFGWLPHLLMGLLGLLLGWLLFRGKVQAGDLSIEGEGQLRADADSLRARVNELEGRVGRRDVTITGLESQMTATPTSADASDDDASYALEWRNRYLAARVKYLEGRIVDTPAPKKPAAKKKAAPKKKKVAPKKKVVKKASPKAASKPRVLYDSPTDGKPDDLKLISGVGPKLEKLLNKNGVYYFRQIGAWNKGNVKMVNDKLDAFPGRIQRDEWVRQAKGLAKGAASELGKKKKAPAKKKAAPKKAVAKKAPAKKLTKAEADMVKYLANVRKYDPKASKKSVENIVKYCGISLRSRDASLVACSDEKELDRVVKNFCTKKLGMTKNQKETVAGVCTQMKPDRFKSRVTFYYLCAKSARKLAMFK